MALECLQRKIKVDPYFTLPLKQTSNVNALKVTEKNIEDVKDLQVGFETQNHIESYYIKSKAMLENNRVWEKALAIQIAKGI